MADDFDDLLGSITSAQNAGDDDECEDFTNADLADLDDAEDLDDDEVGDNGERAHARDLGGKGFAKSLKATNVDRVLRGAPPIWYARLLGMGRTTVQRKLDHLSPTFVGNGTRLYDPREALPYLVQPHDLGQHIAKMNPKDMPERLRKEYWTARKVEQQVRKESRDLWESAAVTAAFGDILKLVRDTVILWADTIDDSVGLSTQQLELLDTLTRDLLTQVADKVEKYANADETESQEAEFGDEGQP